MITKVKNGYNLPPRNTYKKNINSWNVRRLEDSYFTSTHQKKRRVALHIKETLDSKQVYSDEEGRFLMVEIMIKTDIDGSNICTK